MVQLHPVPISSDACSATKHASFSARHPAQSSVLNSAAKNRRACLLRVHEKSPISVLAVPHGTEPVPGIAAPQSPAPEPAIPEVSSMGSVDSITTWFHSVRNQPRRKMLKLLCAAPGRLTIPVPAVDCRRPPLLPPASFCTWQCTSIFAGHYQHPLVFHASHFLRRMGTELY